MQLVRPISVACWRRVISPRCLGLLGVLQLRKTICSPLWHPGCIRELATPARSVNFAEWSRRKDLTHVPDTIYALSTAPGKAAIAVIRISGPACLDIYGALCPNKAFPHPRSATLRKIYGPSPSPSEIKNTTDQQTRTRVLDSAALILYFPAPHTATGEDVLELHVHGGTAIVRSILEAIRSCDKSPDSRTRRRSGQYSHVRAAEPGEFTKRAFYNGRLDLVQAEALGESLSAETEMQRRLAVEGQGGELGKRYEEWRSMLLYARGELEALIDFSEDQHFDESPLEFVRSIEKQVLALTTQIDLHVLNARKGELLRDGISVALLGAPNAGKSSLLNLIVGREAAIVSAEAGTTRDIVDVSIDLNGWLVRVGDLAGLRSGARGGIDISEIGPVEREGIRRARERALESDVVIVLLSTEEARHTSTNIAALAIDSELVDTVDECRRHGKTIVFLLNKIDLLGSDPADVLQLLEVDVQEIFGVLASEKVLAVSCKQAGDTTDYEDDSKSQKPDAGGIQAFLQSLTTIFEEMTAVSVDCDHDLFNHSVAGLPRPQAYWAASLSVSHRQSTYLQECLVHLNHFLEQSQPSPATNTSPLGRSYSSFETKKTLSASHHVDNHEDLVGEISLDTDLDHQDRDFPASDIPDMEIDIVTAAEHLRAAASCLAKITGRGDGGDVEDVLGVVFEK